MGVQKYFPDRNLSVYSYEQLSERLKDLDYAERNSTRRAVPRQQEIKAVRLELARRDADTAASQQRQAA